ncbi:MAG: Sec-independent protein translocase subunit TatB [Arcobacter sp.]|nr:Sec-independent protein translocase subunit TatB [Arcobacter sp.]
MFGMGFMEIILIAAIAIIALGPDKLPTAMVEIAKFIKKFKSGVEDAKSTLDNELNITEMKAEAAKYKAQIEDAKSSLNVKEKINLNLDNIVDDDKINISNINDDYDDYDDDKKETINKKENKSTKKEKVELEAATNSNADAMNKFKIDFDDIEDEK